MSYKLSKKSLDNLKGVHPDLIRTIAKAIQSSPIDFGILKSLRTVKDQEDLYAQGRTTPGKKVTWTLKSLHIAQKDGFSHAIDVVVYIDGVVSWNEAYYKELSHYIKEAAKELKVAIEWGGDWTSNKDYPHYELSKSYRQ